MKMPKQKRKRSLQMENIVTKDNGEISPKKAKQEQPTIEEVEFKFLLRDKDTVMEGLQKFVLAAEAYTNAYPCQDIVAKYCSSSPTLEELWIIIEPSSCTLKINEVALAFQCLEQILIRIGHDLEKLTPVGEAIVQKILNVHMGQIYNCLKNQNKSKTIKSALMLLIAMVTLNDKTKKAVLTRLNFGHINFPPLFKRRNRKDPHDVRSCMILLTLAFLLDSQSDVIKTIVQQKTFLQSIFGGLVYDSQEVVTETLTTVLDKVVRCSEVSKTEKVKLFSEVSLKQICELFNWKGPTGWTSGKKKKDQDTMVVEADEKEKSAVCKVAQEFLTELCCSHKFGINFYDKTVGTGERNLNQILTHFLETLVKTLDDPHVSRLTFDILCACPDQIKPVLNTLCPMLSPRWSDKWSNLMSWLAEVITNLYSSVPKKLDFLSQPDLKDASSIVAMGTVLCLPPPKVCAIIQQSVKHEDVHVRHKALHLVQVLSKEANCVINELTQKLCTEKASKLGEVVLDLFKANVFIMLPPVNMIFTCADKIMQKMATKDKSDQRDINLNEHACVVLQVLACYQQLSPSLLSEKPKDLGKLMEMVGQLADNPGDNQRDVDDVDMDKEHQMLPQLFLLKLLSKIDAKTLSLGREGMLHKLLLYASHCSQHRSACVSLICKMLQNVEVFSNHDKELNAWMETALKTNDQYKTIKFLASSLTVLLNNPAPYVDRLLEINSISALSDDSMTGNSGKEKIALSDILKMDLSDLEKNLEKYELSLNVEQSHSLDLPLTPLMLVILDSLVNPIEDDYIKKYVSDVLVQLVHLVHSPLCLVNILHNSTVKLDANVRDYVETNSRKTKKKICKNNEIDSSNSMSEQSSAEISHIDGNGQQNLVTSYIGIEKSVVPSQQSEMLSKFPHQTPSERQVSLDQLLRELTRLTSSKTNRNKEMEAILLDLFPLLIHDFKDLSFLSYWNKLVTNTLKCLYLNPKLLNLLCQLVPFVYSSESPVTSGSDAISAPTMFHMLVNHTLFMKVMLEAEHAEVKNELVHLLYILGQFNESLFNAQLSQVFICSYTATLTETDQRLLLMLKKCQKSSVKTFECPTTWGKIAVDNHLVRKVLGPSLHSEASMKTVLEQIDQNLLHESILNFPLRRVLEDDSVHHASDVKSNPSCYDSNFLLPLFVQILSPDKVVPLHLFVDRGCLSYLLIALSSHDLKSRLLAYRALNDFYSQADGSRWREKLEVKFVLDLLNASRSKDNQKLPFVLALFFGRVIRLLLHPEDPLYMPITKFLLAKPEIDFNNIPEFYQLFYSASIQNKEERHWLLSLLCDGIRETSDYKIYKNRLIFKILFCFYQSSLCDAHSQELILQCVRNACKEKFIAVDLVKNHGLMSWLLVITQTLSEKHQLIDLVCDLLHTLWVSLTSKKYLTSSHAASQGPERKQSEGVSHGAEGQAAPTSVVPMSTRVEFGLIAQHMMTNLKCKQLVELFPEGQHHWPLNLCLSVKDN